MELPATDNTANLPHFLQDKYFLLPISEKTLEVIQKIFDPLPRHLVHVVIECPLSKIYNIHAIENSLSHIYK